MSRPNRMTTHNFYVGAGRFPNVALTNCRARVYVRHVEDEAEPIMQQPIRRTVGRRRTPFERLAHVEDLNRFFKKYVPGAFAEHDSVGRRIDVHIFGKLAIKFWNDSADRHVKILDIHLADHS